jgi:hypothetical protein
MLKVKDKSDSYYTEIPGWFSLPPRLLFIGKSQYSGKTTCLLNALLRDNMFGPHYKGENIYIISPSLETDEKLKKLIDFKNIPPINLIPIMDEEILKELWDKFQADYLEAVEEKKKPPNVIVIFDDVSASGSLKSKKNGMMAQFACVGRHLNVGFICTAQKLTDVPTVVRENLTGVIAFEMSEKQLNLLAADHSFFPKRTSFFKMFHSAIQEPRDFLMINYSAPSKAERFRDKNLNVIDWTQFL